MHVSKTSPTHWMMILEPGEEIFQTILDWAKSEGIPGGWVTGIGAMKEIEIGAYLLASREYVTKTFRDGEYELLQLNGNLSLKEGAPFVHLHATFGDHDLQTFGGHLFRATSAVTVELQIQTYSNSPVREGDERVGLHTICRWVSKS